MKTNFVLFSLLTLSGSPLFCADAPEKKFQLINQARTIGAKRNGNTVTITAGDTTKLLDINNTPETFFGDIGVQICQDDKHEGDIILQAFVKDDVDHLFDKNLDRTRKGNHPILFFLRLHTEEKNHKNALEHERRTMEIAERTALESDGDFS